MLRHAGVRCFAIPADLDEAAIKREFSGDTASLAATLAGAKAQMVAASYPEALVIGADQILDCEGRIFSKPASLEAAARQLSDLRGRPHTLVTAAAVYQNGAPVWSDVAAARLTMRNLSDEFIDHYVAHEGEAICASVGAYRLEGLGAQLFDAIEGDYFTILGLNLLPLLGFLRRVGALAA